MAARAMLPVIVSQLVVLVKDTALGYIISYSELLQLGVNNLAANFGNVVQAAIVAAMTGSRVATTTARDDSTRARPAESERYGSQVDPTASAISDGTALAAGTDGRTMIASTIFNLDEFLSQH